MYIYIYMYIISTFIIFIQYLHLLWDMSQYIFCFVRSSDATSTMRFPPWRGRPKSSWLASESEHRCGSNMLWLEKSYMVWDIGIYVWYIYSYDVYNYIYNIIIYHIYNIGITDLSSNLFVIFQWEVNGCRWWKHCPDFEKQSFQVRCQMWCWQVADVYELSHDTKRIRLSLGSPTTTLGSLATEAG